MNSKSTASWIAWSMCALSLTLTALSLLLLTLNLSYPSVHIYDHWLEDTLATVSCSIVGGIIVSHYSDSSIGWLFCVEGLLVGIGHLGAEYATYTLVAAPGSLPAGEAAAWIYSWEWVPQLGLGAFLFLLFPNGRLLGSRWRWFAGLSALLLLAVTVLAAFSPGPIIALGSVQNPLGIEGLPNFYELQALVFALILVATASLFVRLHRARAVERQQTKWFTYSAALAISGAILTYIISPVIGAPLWIEWFVYVLALVGPGEARELAVPTATF